MNECERKVAEQVTDDAATTVLQRLIQAPSFFPPGNTVEVASVCSDIFEEHGIPRTTVALEPTLPSVLAELGDGSGKNLVFHSHIDTVPPGEISKWRYSPFSGAVAEGNIYGRGAGDCKGSTAAQIMAAIALKKAGVKLQGRLTLACVTDEEGGAHKGTEWLRESGVLKPDFLVIGEQTANRIAIAERQAVWIRIDIEGRACHGALPWKGENAILRMARVLEEIETWLMPRLAGKKHPYLPGSTLNVGTISGGLKVNIVPDICSVEIDRRVLPDENADTVVAEAHETIRRLQERTGPFPYSIVVTSDQGPSVNTSPDEPFVKTMQSASQDVAGVSHPLTGYRQGSDGRWFARDGFPIIIFGPSDPAVGHSINEHCPVKELVEAAQILAITAMRLLGTSAF